jgi:acyl dehydratase
MEPIDLGSRRVAVDPADAAVLAEIFGSGVTGDRLPPFAELAVVNRYLWEGDWYEEVGVADGSRLLQLRQEVCFTSPSPVGEDLELVSRLVSWYALGHLDVVEVELRLRSAASGEPRSTWRGEYTIDRTGRAPGGAGRRPRRRGPTRPGSPLATRRMTFDRQAVERFARASGDPNLIHLDPEVARQAGFDRPILHGCMTLAVAATFAAAAAGPDHGRRLLAAAADFRHPVHCDDRIDLRVYEGSVDGIHPVRADVEGRTALRAAWVQMG